MFGSNRRTIHKGDKMKTYWEYSDTERMLLSKEEIQSLIDIELMTKGIIKVNPPTFKEIKELTQFDKLTYYKVEGIIFNTIEQAHAFLKLCPMKEGYDYYGAGYDYKFAELIDMTIRNESLFKEKDIKINSLIFKENKAAKEYNEAEKKRYEKELSVMDDATHPVWDDWMEKQNIKYKCHRINETYQDYLKMTEGNEQMAYAFLSKIYSESEITLAESMRTPHE